MVVEISDWNDLDNVRNDLSGDYVLVNDLDSETDGYTGIGDDWNPIGEQAFDGDFYEGVFDGDGFKIRDLIVDTTEGFLGLFSGLGSDGEIKNLSVMGDITTTSDSFGATILVADSNGEIENCAAHGSVTGLSISGVGGLVYQNEGTVTDSYSTASVEGDDRVAGLVGDNRGPIETSYAVGSVTGNTDVSGLCSDPFDNGTVIDSYWDTESTGQDTSEGGTGLTTAEMQGGEAETNMNGFDFANVWNTVLESDNDTSADGYPILLALDREDQLDAQGILIALTVETNPATNMSEFSATLNGELVELDDEFDNADLFFEFGKSITDNQTPIQTLTEPATFDELVDELEPNTTFEFRAIAEAQDADNVTFSDEGDILTFDTEIVTLDGTISLDEVGVENADVVANNLTQETFGGQTRTDIDGNYTLDLPNVDRLDTVAVAVDFDDGTERYGRLVTTVIE